MLQSYSPNRGSRPTSPPERAPSPTVVQRDNGMDTPSLAKRVSLLMQDVLKWQDGIEAALQYGEASHTFDDMVAKLLRGELHFYAYDRCCLLMQVVTFPQFKNYHCFVAAGEQDALDAARDDMLIAARGYGCKHLSISGRVGWERRLKSRGWKHVLSTMYLET